MNKQEQRDSYFKNKGLIRAMLLKYTKKAFMMLPDLENPRMLDLGCGSGVATCELAKLSRGYVAGLDINQDLLKDFKSHITKSIYEKKINIIRGSMLDLPFKNACFDIIWGEGVIASTDFLKGLLTWREFIKINGYLVIHDDYMDVNRKTAFIENNGYKLIDQFYLSHDVWWYDYYGPLEKLINDIINRNVDLAEIDKDQREILMFKKNPEQFRSIFFIMQKI